MQAWCLPPVRPESAVRREATVSDEHVDMRVKIEQFSRGLDKPHGPWGHGGAIGIGFEVEFEGSPGTAGELAQKLPVEAEEHSPAWGW